MKTQIIRLTALLLLICLTIPLFAGCNGNNPSQETDAQTTETQSEVTTNIPSSNTALTATGDLIMKDGMLNLSVASSSAVLDLSNRIEVRRGAQWSLFEDSNAEKVIENKTVTLSEGVNTYYIKVSYRDEGSVYTVKIQYQSVYTIEFYANTVKAIDTQKISIGEKASAPVPPVREGYTFLGWFNNGTKFDFSTAPTSDCLLIAHWNKINKTYMASDTSVPTFTSVSASLHIVWKDYADIAGLRPTSVNCVLLQEKDGKTSSFDILLSKDSVEWKDNSNELVNFRVKLAQDSGGYWTLRIDGLPSDGVYTLTQSFPIENYSTLQSGTEVVNTISGYIPSIDSTSSLTARNSRLYDCAGNLIVLKGVVTVNVGTYGFESTLSEKALEKLKAIGTNAIRITMQLVGSSGSGYVYYPNGSKRTGDYNDSNATRVADYIKEQEIQQINKVIQTASDMGIYVIIDWGILTSNPYQYVNEASEFFGILAKEHVNNPYVIYEICNEPLSTWGVSNGQTNSIKYYAETIIDVIRTQGSKALIIVSPNNCATALSVYSGKATAGDDPIDDPLDDDHGYNVAYTFHCYPSNYAYTTYSWKLRDAYNAGLTVITTEMSPMDATFDAPDKASYDMQESAKYLRMYEEWDMSLLYFRYNSPSATGSSYNENLMFKPSIDLAMMNWTRDDMTECGKWYYDIVTGDGVFSTPNYNTVQLKNIRAAYDATFTSYGLGNLFPGSAVACTASEGKWFFKVSQTDNLTDIQYYTYCNQVLAKIIKASGNKVTGTDGTPYSSSNLPEKKELPMDLYYIYNGKKIHLRICYEQNNDVNAFGISLTIS